MRNCIDCGDKFEPRGRVARCNPCRRRKVQAGKPGIGHSASLPEKLAYWSIPEPNSGCLLWFGRTSDDRYGDVSQGNRKQPAHRAAWVCAHGPIPNGLLVLHKCDVGFCINPDHLFLGTQSDNITDMWAKNRRPRPTLFGKNAR